MDDGTAAEQTDDEVPMSSQAISGGSGRVTQWLDHLTNGLTLAGILALVGVTWRLSDTVTRIDTLLAAQVQQNDREFVRIDTTLTRHDERITSLEREQRLSLPNSDNRQKR